MREQAAVSSTVVTIPKRACAGQNSERQVLDSSVPPSVLPCHKLSVKVINPKKRKKYKIYHLDGFNEFACENRLKESIFNKLGKNVVHHSLGFEVGYFEGSTKMSFKAHEFEEKLHYLMVKGKYPWCYRLSGDKESDSEEEALVSKQKKSTVPSVEIKAERIETLAKDLQRKHGDKYLRIQYKLWAEVIDSKKHTSLDEQPLRCIWGRPQKDKGKKDGSGSFEQMATAFISLATSMTAVLQPMHRNNHPPSRHAGGTDAATISPGRNIDLQENYYIICRYYTPCMNRG